MVKARDMSTTNKHASFRVGDRVKMDFGPRKLTGVIVEDRGPIGVGGRHLFRVDVPMDPFDPMTVEVPEDEIEALPTEEVAPTRIDNAKIVEYLRSGGLVSILRSNLSGGKNQPRVWLCLDNLGNVTHTFVPDRGVIGGQVVPFWALHEDKIFRPKQDAVLSLLQSFGLSQQESENVLSDVALAP
jgi:hypothetical protein